MTMPHGAPGDGSSSVTVEAIMSCPLITIAPEAELWEARAKMREHHIHHLLVEDRGRIVGIMSDRDIAHRLAPAGREMLSRHEEEALRRRVLRVATFRMVTIPASALIEEAAAMLMEREVSALPVRHEDGRVIGIVTSVDLLRGLLACVLPAHAA